MKAVERSFVDVLVLVGNEEGRKRDEGEKREGSLVWHEGIFCGRGEGVIVTGCVNLTGNEYHTNVGMRVGGVAAVRHNLFTVVYS